MNKNLYANTKLRILELDYLRGIAVLLVFFFHAKVLDFGYIGVDLFFLISGIVISKSLSNKDLFFKDIIFFYFKRLRRLLPALFIYITISIILFMLIAPLNYFNLSNWILKGLLSLMFLINIYYFKHEANYFESDFLDIFSHLWSLSSEFQIYIIVPFILFFINKINDKKTFLIITLTFIFIFNLSIINQNNFFGNYYSSIFRSIEFILGVLISFLFFKKINLNIKYFKIISLFYISIFIINYFLFEIDEKYVWIYISIYIFSFLFLKIDNLKFIFKNLIIFLGKISYSFYLWHLLIIIVVTMFVKIKIISIIISLIITVIISNYSYKFFENPKNYQSLTFNVFNYLVIFFVFFAFLVSAKNYFINKKIFTINTEQKIKKLQEFNYFDKKVKEYYNIINFKDYVDLSENCYSIIENFDEKKCLFNSKNKNKYNYYFILTGDSHAEALFPMIYDSELYEKLYFDTFGGSHFSKSIVRVTEKELNNQQLKIMIQKNLKKQRFHYDRVIKNFSNASNYQKKFLIIHNRNIFYLENDLNFHINNENYTKPKKLNFKEYLDIFSSEIADILKILNKDEFIILVLPIYDPKKDISSCSLSNYFSSFDECYFTKDVSKVNLFNKKFKQLKTKHKNLILLDLNDIICPENMVKCKYINNDNILIFGDSNHLSKAFAKKYYYEFDKKVLRSLDKY